jgi:APA family basic amino acid/polyamine antiporter
VSIVLSGMVSYTRLSDSASGGHANLATAFKANGVTWATEVISIGAPAGLTTVVIVLILGQTRVMFAMSRDGLLPRPLARTGSRGTPVRIMVVVGTLFAFVLVSASVIVLRRTRGDLHRDFRVPWVPVLPVAAIVACVWLMLNLTLLTWIRFGVWMVVGLVVYMGYGRRHSVLASRIAAESA